MVQILSKKYYGTLKKLLRMKVLITILGLLNGGYMLLDGIYVMLKGKYIGPEKPGPWSNLFTNLKSTFLILVRYLLVLDYCGYSGFIAC